MNIDVQCTLRVSRFYRFQYSFDESADIHTSYQTIDKLLYEINKSQFPINCTRDY